MLPSISARRRVEHFWREMNSEPVRNHNQSDELDLAVLLVDEEETTNKNLISSGEKHENPRKRSERNSKVPQACAETRL